MTKRKQSDDLLSAYLDGELSPEEQSAAEQLLQRSVQARRELDELRAISELLQSLPNESAPHELAPSILNRAERETLLSAVEPLAGSAPRGRWWFTAGLVATVAAVMMITISLSEHREDSPNMPSVAESSRPKTSKADSLVAIDENSKLLTGADVAETRQQTEIDGSRDGTANSVSGSSSVNAAPPSNHKPSKEVPSTASADETLQPPAREFDPLTPASPINRADLKNAQRGDVFPYFDSSGSGIMTYTVTVVDVKRGVDSLQVLLQKHDIPPQSSGGLSDENFDDDKQAERQLKNPKTGDAHQLIAVAVYVQTTSVQFASVLQDLRENELLADLRPQTPFDVEPPKQTISTSKPQSKVEKKPNETKPSRAAERLSASKFTSSEVSSFHLRLQVDSNRLTGRHQQAAIEEVPKRPNDHVDTTVRRRELASGNQIAAISKSATVRILFVFQQAPEGKKDQP